MAVPSGDRFDMNSLQSKVQMIHRLPDSDVFELGGLRYRLVWKDFHKYKTTEEEILLLKSWKLLELEYAIFSSLQPRRVVEFGVFEGGSSFLWRELLGCVYLGIDIADENPLIRQKIREKKWDDSLFVHFNVSQDDSDQIRGILGSRFNHDAVDLVIDDASHQYHLSRRTFEFMFPLLRNGGVYALEDWGWAHLRSDRWQKELFWRENPALTNLVFEFSMLVASNAEWFEAIDLRSVDVSQCAFVHKNRDCPPLSDIDLDTAYVSQGRKLIPI